MEVGAAFRISSCERLTMRREEEPSAFYRRREKLESVNTKPVPAKMVQRLQEIKKGLQTTRAV